MSDERRAEIEAVAREANPAFDVVGKNHYLSSLHRSPQGEDHEAGDTERLVAALRLTTGHIEHDGLRAQIHALLAEFPAPKADEKQEGP
jgi:hypothetical protein